MNASLAETRTARPETGSRSVRARTEENPALVARLGGPAERIGERLLGRRPAAIWLVGLVLCWAALALASILVGLAFTHWILPLDHVNAHDEAPVSWLADHRTPFLDTASYLGSELSGGWVIPALVGAVVVISAFQRRWLLAGFVLSSIVIESGTYRATVFFVNRDRPDVKRLENLPVDASFPSGHTAASIALFWGLALLLSSRISSTSAKVAIWACAVAITPIVAVSRMYRGMHHPLDIVAGLFIGIAALSLALLLARVTGYVDRRRKGIPAT